MFNFLFPEVNNDILAKIKIKDYFQDLYAITCNIWKNPLSGIKQP